MFDVNEAINDIINDLNGDFCESVYEEIFEELCDRVDYGELSLEDAEVINEVAYNRYITESILDSKNGRKIISVMKEDIKKLDKILDTVKKLYNEKKKLLCITTCEKGIVTVINMKAKIKNMEYTDSDYISEKLKKNGAGFIGSDVGIRLVNDALYNDAKSGFNHIMRDKYAKANQNDYFSSLSEDEKSKAIKDMQKFKVFVPVNKLKKDVKKRAKIAASITASQISTNEAISKSDRRRTAPDSPKSKALRKLNKYEKLFKKYKEKAKKI